MANPAREGGENHLLNPAYLNHIAAIGSTK
jgi:hypothetical protein